MAAGLATAAANLGQLQLNEREEMALRQRRQALELGARLASANAERDIYERDEAASQASRHSVRSTKAKEIEDVRVKPHPDAASLAERRGPESSPC